MYNALKSLCIKYKKHISSKTYFVYLSDYSFKRITLTTDLNIATANIYYFAKILIFLCVFT